MRSPNRFLTALCLFVTSCATCNTAQVESTLTQAGLATLGCAANVTIGSVGPLVDNAVNALLGDTGAWANEQSTLTSLAPELATCVVMVALQTIEKTVLRGSQPKPEVLVAVARANAFLGKK
jgi:hypothetical protein